MDTPQAAANAPSLEGLGDHLTRLAAAVEEVRAGHRLSPRTIKLLRSGTAKMAQKVIEEAAELGIEAVRGDRASLIGESVDLVYNLAVLWSEAGVSLDDIAAEMARREQMLGMAEKLPKVSSDAVPAATRLPRRAAP
ncbi:MAG TPA: phosphoribosyl-ATP diphosphatase [Caulobacteraceae bacterium]|jgi:phosphoribosyl-ATP pyrophosphohydrolase